MQVGCLLLGAEGEARRWAGAGVTSARGQPICREAGSCLLCLYCLSLLFICLSPLSLLFVFLFVCLCLFLFILSLLCLLFVFHLSLFVSFVFISCLFLSSPSSFTAAYIYMALLGFAAAGLVFRV